MTPGVPGTLNNAVGQAAAGRAGCAGYIGQPLALSPTTRSTSSTWTGSYVFRQPSAATSSWRTGARLGQGNSARWGSRARAGGRQQPDGRGEPHAGAGRVDRGPDREALPGRRVPLLHREDETSVVPFSETGAVQYTNYRVHARSNSAGRGDVPVPYAIQGTAGWNFDSMNRDCRRRPRRTRASAHCARKRTRTPGTCGCPAR